MMLLDLAAAVALLWLALQLADTQGMLLAAPALIGALYFLVEAIIGGLREMVRPGD